MKFISTVPEIRKHLPVPYTSSFDRVGPFFANAEHNYLRLVIGKNQCDAIAAAYAGASPVDPADPEQGKDLDSIADVVIREAVFLAQKITVNLGYLVGIPTLSLMFGDTGIQVFSNQDTKQAFKWQVDEFKSSIRELGFDALEQFLIHLEESPDKFPEYINSPEFKKNEQFLIQTAADFSENFNINGSRYTFHVISYLMKRIEDHTVKPLFGIEFFESLKSGNLSAKEQYLVTNYLMPGIALLTGAKAVIERIITLKNGIASVNLDVNSDSDKANSAATGKQVKDAYDQLTTDGSQFLSDGMEFIKENAGYFPGYVAPASRRRYKSPSDITKGVFLP